MEPHIIEAALNHYSGHRGGVAGIYNRAKYERQVRAALALWADHLPTITGANIVAFFPKKASETA